MSSTLPLLFIGLVLGALMGWLAHAAQHPPQRAANTQVPNANELGRSLEHSIERSLSEKIEHNLDKSLEIAMLKATERIGLQLQELEAGRSAEMSVLGSQIQAITRTSARLNDRTDRLVNALRSPNVRGRWGEVQLERVVELGGMKKHVDFEPQATGIIDGNHVRPDLIINLAGGRHIVVDAKVPFASYLDAIETTDPEEHLAFMRRHAHLLRGHIGALANKDYIEAFHPTPEFVVLFVPADPFLDAALSVDPELLEYAFERNIVLATPTSLFALLRTVALGWRQADLSDKARQIHKLGQELYARLNRMGEHFNSVGRSLEKAVDSYNSTLSSLDSRVMVTARRLQDMDVPARTDKQPTRLEGVDSWPRHVPWQEEDTPAAQESSG